ncbi:hypothetical protein L6452_01050 [Arctium lappa]|uniref:Uncharacterized protein n=1 Tax=Arctium lappa TaxID=4217 RepID=A0ACB9FGG2_ARCLA|nr:hypothetical protein L6452_01050 [Arctium lappa]
MEFYISRFLILVSSDTYYSSEVATKTWSFKGGPASHGASLSHRSPRSIGLYKVPLEPFGSCSLSNRCTVDQSNSISSSYCYLFFSSAIVAAALWFEFINPISFLYCCFLTVLHRIGLEDCFDDSICFECYNIQTAKVTYTECKSHRPQHCRLGHEIIKKV